MQRISNETLTPPQRGGRLAQRAPSRSSYPWASALEAKLCIPERLRSRHWEGYDKVMGGAQSRYGSGALLAVPALHKDGRQISIEFTILPLRSDAGSLLGIAAQHIRSARGRVRSRCHRFYITYHDDGSGILGIVNDHLS